MHCSWKEIEAYRYAEGSLEPERSRSFIDHLSTCAVCRGRVAEAQRVEGVLGAGLTPVAAPVTLASRVAGSVALDREAVHSSGRRSWRADWEWPAVFRRRAVSLALSGLALIAALSLVTQVVAPGAVAALVRQVLRFVPGLGIQEAADGALVAAGPVQVEALGATFTVEALVSDGQETRVKYAIAGLPGGKEGWESGTVHGSVALRLEDGTEYAVVGQSAGYGGSPEETTVEGEMTFPALPPITRRVALAVPLDTVAPPAVLPGSDAAEWVLAIPLVPLAESSLPAATPQDAEATVGGITLRASASVTDGEHTVLLVEGEAEDGAWIRGLGHNGADPAEAALLRDAPGHEYARQVGSESATWRSGPYRQDLYFPPLTGDPGTLTLEVPIVRVAMPGSVEVSIAVAGREAGAAWGLDRTVDLAGYPVRLVSARLAGGPRAEVERDLWLYIDVDLGPAVTGRTLTAFRAEALAGGGAMQSLGRQDGGQQMSMFGVPAAPDASEVTVRLADPILDVEGPWVLTVPVDGAQ